MDESEAECYYTSIYLCITGYFLAPSWGWEMGRQCKITRLGGEFIFFKSLSLILNKR